MHITRSSIVLVLLSLLLGDAPSWPAVAGHAETMVAVLEAAGLASYATFCGCDKREYSLAGFRKLYDFHGQHAAWQARQRQRGEAPDEGKEGEAAGEAPPAA